MIKLRVNERKYFSEINEANNVGLLILIYELILAKEVTKERKFENSS